MNATLTPTEATTLPSPACGGGEFATLAFLQMIERAARDPSIDIDKLDRLLLMRERENARVAEQTFNAAMAAAQAEMEPPSVTVLRGASKYPMSEGSVLRSCLDPPQRSVRTSAADLRSNRPGTDYRVDPL